MTTTEQPQIYLITPPSFDLATFPETLARVLDAHPVACLRLDLATRNEDRLSRAADSLRDVAHSRDVAIVITDRHDLSERLGLDGVHLSDPTKPVRTARKALGPDAIVGSFCGASRHAGMEAGEAGADYVAFGPLAPAGAEAASLDLFAWWSEMIEVPVVAEGALSLEITKDIAASTDFLALGEEIWDAEDPVTQLVDYLKCFA